MLDSLFDDLILHSDILESFTISSDMPIESLILSYDNKLELLDMQLEDFILENLDK